MKQIVFLMAGCIAIVSGAGAAKASACTGANQSVETEYKVATYVLTGKIYSIGKPFHKYYTYHNKNTYDEYQRISVQVETSYKGTPKRMILFYNSNDSARVPVKTGDRWLLFFFKTDDWQHIAVDTCGLSGLLSDPKTMTTLRDIKNASFKVRR